MLKSGASAKVAVTDWAKFKTIVQVLESVPVHAPLQLEKIDTAAAVAVSETDVPCA